jgi:hypothetical protein
LFPGAYLGLFIRGECWRWMSGDDQEAAAGFLGCAPQERLIDTKHKAVTLLDSLRCSSGVHGEASGYDVGCELDGGAAFSHPGRDAIRKLEDPRRSLLSAVGIWDL